MILLSVTLLCFYGLLESLFLLDYLSNLLILLLAGLLPVLPRLLLPLQLSLELSIFFF